MRQDHHDSASAHHLKVTHGDLPDGFLHTLDDDEREGTLSTTRLVRVGVDAGSPQFAGGAQAQMGGVRQPQHPPAAMPPLDVLGLG
jgi:hypothetical protein